LSNMYTAVLVGESFRTMVQTHLTECRKAATPSRFGCPDTNAGRGLPDDQPERFEAVIRCLLASVVAS
jgi:hypothetical protein